MRDMSKAFALLWACRVATVLGPASCCGTLLCWLPLFPQILRQRPMQMSKTSSHESSCLAAPSDLTSSVP